VAEQALYFLDNSGKRVHRFAPATGETRSWEMPDVVTSLALRVRGGAVITLRTGLHLLDFEKGQVEPFHLQTEPRSFIFNDGKVDRRGRFMIGASTIRHEAPTNEGGLYRLDPDHRLIKLDDDVHYSNGPCWSPDGRIFYFADSWRKTIYAYDYDMETGGVSGRRPFAHTEALGGLPDGATVDSGGRLWSAIYEGGKVAAFSPDGALEQVIDMPAGRVSSVMFGGPGLDRLFVTSISHDDSDGGGLLYVIDGLDARGLPEPRFAG
jgi:sugar lactone lactonase YvrE